MKNLKVTLAILAMAIVTLTAVSCKKGTNKNESLKTDAKEVIMENKVEVQPGGTLAFEVGAQVPKELVCMVNNAYMGKAQIPVPVNGKTYYGCCDMCVERLNKDNTARTAIDPYSKKPVDKTEAYIVLIDKVGNVAYFESNENYLNYKKAL